jgi:O-antigen/teichoic acid export membrane protein
MIRNILSFAILAVVVLLVLKITLGALGALIGLTVSVLVLAAMGYVLYLILRLVSPRMAARVRQMIRGNPATMP